MAGLLFCPVMGDRSQLVTFLLISDEKIVPVVWPNTLLVFRVAVIPNLAVRSFGWKPLLPIMSVIWSID